MKEFEPYLKQMKNEQNDFILLGDTNYNLIETATNDMCREYFDKMTYHGLTPQITLPTKLNRNSCKLYDHIFTRCLNPDTKITSGIYLTKISDHLPVLMSITTTKKRKTYPKFKLSRNSTKRNINNFLGEVG